MRKPIDDLRIREVRPLLPAQLLAEELPVSDESSEVVFQARAQVAQILEQQDSRLLVVVGPCSIHDPVAAMDYATRLKVQADRFQDDLLLIMRTYFEKPRTSVGWKGLINDPDLDESFRINKGLRAARRLLLEIAELGLPAATEFLDTTVPQHLAELVSWGAIGARTTESQIHRALASGLSMPVGFKNNTEGNVAVALDAIRVAREPHWFPSTTKQGVAAISHTSGNPYCHLILRGGAATGPNYETASLDQVERQLGKHELPQILMVDCSHGNSAKDHRRQLVVAEDLAKQIESGRRSLVGVMLESNLVEGRQTYVPGEAAVYGQSITDACLSLDQTLPIFERLARARRSRMGRI